MSNKRIVLSFTIVLLLFILSLTVMAEIRINKEDLPGDIFTIREEEVLQGTFNLDSQLAIINDEVNNLDSKLLVLGNTTFVPVKYIADILNQDLHWNEHSQTATLEHSETFIMLNTVNGEATIFYDDQPHENIEMISFVHNSATYVPIRLFVELLGGELEYNSDTRDIVISF